MTPITREVPPDVCAVVGCGEDAAFRQAFLSPSGKPRKLYAIPMCRDHYGLRDMLPRDE